MTNKSPTWEEITDIRQTLHDAVLKYWLNDNLFTFNWWLIFVLIIGFPIVWWIFAEKKRIFEILTYGLLVGAVAVFFDVIGSSYVLFGWRTKPLPLTPTLLPYFTILPVVFMLMYQIFKSFKWFSLANVLMALVFAFVIEPVIVWMGIYDLSNWRHFYSFLVYLALGIPTKAFMMLLVRKQGEVMERRETKNEDTLEISMKRWFGKKEKVR
jgi:hypothetical protein